MMVLGSHTCVAVAKGFLALCSFGFAYVGWMFDVRLSRETRLHRSKESFYTTEQLRDAIDFLRKEINELDAIKKHQSIQDDGVSTEAVHFENDWEEPWSKDQLELNSPQEVFKIFEKVDNLMEGKSKERKLAFALLTSYENKYRNNVEFLWRIAKACRMVAAISEDPKKKKNLFYKAVEYAKRSLNADKGNAEAHKWLAIILGDLSNYLGVKEKIKNGALFKEHLDKAISINPTDPILHHLLGRFSYKIATLSWIERKVANALFKKMPTGSIEFALDHFQNAEKLKQWKENRFFLVRCFLQLRKYPDAVYWINAAIPMPVLTAEDEIFQKELIELRNKYNDYAS